MFYKLHEIQDRKRVEDVETVFEVSTVSGVCDCYFERFEMVYEELKKLYQEKPDGYVEFGYIGDGDSEFLGRFCIKYRYYRDETSDESLERIKREKSRIDRKLEEEKQKELQEMMKTKKDKEKRINEAKSFLEENGYKVKMLK